ncbi:MAG: phosphotransferase [Sideroxydans sp.]|nr:phosphotransferase [Sideroxydans sp.]
MTDWHGIQSAIHNTAHRQFELAHATPIGGGDINAAFRLQGKDGTRYFAKINDARRLPMFAAEAQGLEALARTQAIRVPRPVAHGTSGKQSYLILEHLELNAHGNAHLLGEQLAALHRNTAEQFGFAHDNFIGSTAQPNAWHSNWITFLRERRLGFQLQLAQDNGHGGKLQDLGAALLERLPVFFAGHTPQPSLLHGDLWSGNHAFLAEGTPAIFDPAAYYGDREADLAMTELFGGYPADFYAAYRTCWPLDEGYAVRRELYNLYHILNHANLFGGGYARQAEGMMQKLLAA